MEIELRGEDIPKKIHLEKLEKQIADAFGISTDDMSLSYQGAGKQVDTTIRFRHKKDSGGNLMNKENGEPVLEGYDHVETIELEPLLTICLPDSIELNRNRLNQVIEAHKPGKTDREEGEEKAVKDKEHIKKLEARLEKVESDLQKATKK
jgi:hypothetical protein